MSRFSAERRFVDNATMKFSIGMPFRTSSGVFAMLLVGRTKPSASAAMVRK